LKGRIRGTLLGAIQAFSGGSTEDSLLKSLVERHRESKTAARHLREAVRAFDQAAILTIHGFCGRMLYENAFESGSLFDTELVTDQEDIKGEIVDDFWRTHFYSASSLFIRFAKTSVLSLATGWPNHI
jgi:exodeoxyribonuclease V beta subunit